MGGDKGKTMETEVRAYKKIMALIVIYCCFFIILLLCYKNALHGPFFFDSVSDIKENQALHINSLSELPKIKYSYNTRPAADVTFALNYLAGGLDTMVYRVTNIGIHALNGLLIFLLFIHFLDISSSSRIEDQNKKYFTALAASLVWLLHPLHIQSVTYIVQRETSMSAMFCLIALLCYITGRGYIQKKNNSHRSIIVPTISFSAAALFWIIAVLSKQNAVILPLLVFGYEILFHADKRNYDTKALVFFSIFSLLVIFLFVIYFLGDNPIAKIQGWYEDKPFTLSQRLLSEARVVIYYFSLLIYPNPSRLNLDYDYPVSTGLISPPTTLICITAIAFMAGFILVLKNKKHLVVFACFWYLAGLLVESTILPLALAFEHRTYLPTIFFFLPPVAWISKKIKNMKVQVLLISFICLILATWTHARNQIWKSDLSLWSDTAQKSPNKARPHVEVGNALKKRGDLNGALAEYKRGVELDPDFDRAHYNLANALSAAGRLKEAEFHYLQALRIDPGYAKAHNNLGLLLAKTGRIDEAIAHYLAAVKSAPRHANAYNNLGLAYAKKRDLDKAISYYQKAIKINPYRPEYHNNLAIAFRRKGKPELAKHEFLEAIRLKPGYYKAYNNLGSLYLSSGRIDEAIKYFKSAISINPAYAKAYNNLGIALKRKGDLKGAKTAFKRALKINPNYKSARRNLQRLTKKQIIP